MSAHTIHVTLADAPTDVLVFLVDHGPANVRDIAHAVAPPDHPMPGTVTRHALGTLMRCGYVRSSDGQWSATDEGTAAVTEARATQADTA